jgi:hypothetical protein
MTSNRPLEDWGKLLGDVPSATAILDRFLHHPEIIQITGRSYRLENRQRGSKETKAPIGSGTDKLPKRAGANETSFYPTHPMGYRWYCLERPSLVLFQAPSDTRRAPGPAHEQVTVSPQ